VISCFAEPVGSRLFLPAGLLKRALMLSRSARLRASRLGDRPEDEALYFGEGESLRYLETLHGSGRPRLSVVGVE